MKSRRVITYARYSPTKRNREDVESIQVQQERMKSWCNAYSYPILAEYTDEELSGDEMSRRPGLLAAMEDVCRVRGLLLVYRLDRLARNCRDAWDIAHTLKKKGACISSIMDGFDTSTDAGNLFYKLLAVFSEWDREQISKRTSSSMRRHQSIGRRMGRTDKLPFGWKPNEEDPTLMMVDDQERRAIKLMREWREEGASFGEICKRLDAAKILRRGKKWADSRAYVRKILLREGAGS